MNDPRYRSSFGFIDLLFNLLIGFVFLFMLAFMLINPVAKKETIKPKAEYFIVLEWDGEKPYDLDIWVKDNLGHVVSFRRPDDALIHLERDDLGTVNDTYYDADGKLVYLKENRETVAIRTNDPRSYLVTVHFYNARKNPAPLVYASVKLIKINPYREEYHKKLFFSQEGQELPAMTFRIDYNGNVHTKPTQELIIKDEVIRKEGA